MTTDDDRVGSHLIAGLQAAGVPDHDQDRGGAALERVRGSIVTPQI